MKMPDYALNSVFAKVRALYGKRLTEKNYHELLSLHSVHEIAEYLKTKTSYSEILEGLNATDELQRSQLESLLQNKMYNDFESVIRFQKAAGGNLYEYFIIKFDTIQILNVLSSLETKSNDYLFTFPLFYQERSKLDLYRLAQVKTQEELLKACEKTIYYPVLRDAIVEYRLTKNLTAIQAEFRNFADTELIKLLAGKKKTSVPAKNEVGNLYKTMKDIHFIKVLYRMLRFSVSEEAANAIASPVLTNFTQKQTQALASEKNADALDEIVQKTYLSDIVAGKSKSDIFHSADEVLYKTLSDSVKRSSDPNTVMFAYFHLSEFEIKNIIHIIEGIRYGLPPEKILPMLCGVSPL